MAHRCVHLREGKMWRQILGRSGVERAADVRV